MTRRTRCSLVTSLLPAFLMLTLFAQSSNYPQLAEKSRKGKEALEQGRFQEAADIYGQLVRALPQNAGMKMNLGVALHMAGRRREAIAQFEGALRLQPDLTDAWVLLGTARLEAGQHRGAAQALEKALALQPDRRQARQMLAEALLSLRRHREAAGHLRELARSDPADTKAWYGLGRAYELMAQEAFDQIQGTAEGSPYWLLLVGESLGRRQKLPNALFFFRRALEKSPDLRGAHQAIADIYKATGHPDWAAIEEEKERAIAAPDCRTEKIVCAFAAGRYLDVADIARGHSDVPSLYWLSRALNLLALDAFSQLAKPPSSPELLKLKAGILINQNQNREAIELLKEALRNSPDDSEAKRKLAEAHYRSRDYDTAQTLLKELLTAESDSPELNLLYGESLLQSQKAEEAILVLKKSVAADPELLPAHSALGRAYLQTGKTAAAVPHLEKALKSDQDGDLHYQLSRAYQSLGKTDLARQMLQRYQEMQKTSRSETQQLEQELKITPP